MFHFDKKNTKSDPKCFATHGTLGHLDPKQPPVKRKPFVAFLGQPFVHRAEMILPAEVYEIVKGSLQEKIGGLEYSRVVMGLGALLDGEFFNEYIKKGNIIMLSQGRLGIDNVYSLHSGILTLTLDRPTYERTGIPGKPWGGPKGNRGSKPRWIIEINLRLPAMLHGKKGFERIVKAFEGVLKEEVEWLFCDLGGSDISPNPLAKHHPINFTVSPVVTRMPEIKVPELRLNEVSGDESNPNDFSDYTTELYEWLSLITLSSPRITSTDQIDPFLSRYTPPFPTTLNHDLVKMTWNGFLPSKWVHETFVKILLLMTEADGGGEKTKNWFSFGVSGFHGSWSRDSRDALVLKLPGKGPGEYLLWEVTQQ